ncbi:MAG: DUF1993 family protein [Leptolyngbya sp. IPPAS B-1204]
MGRVCHVPGLLCGNSSLSCPSTLSRNPRHRWLLPTSVRQSARELLLGINVEDAKLAEVTRIDLGQSLYIELSGNAYVNEFLIPNFYFHMVTAYDILRMAGVPIGKRDYMMHLVPLIRKE